MRVLIKVSEKRKKQIVDMANASKSIKVVGKYYTGCALVQYIYTDKKILAIK